MANFVTSTILGMVKNDYTGWVGMKITVGANDLAISSLGRWVLAGNSQAHKVKITNAATGVDLPGGLVSVGTTGKTAGAFAYANLPTPVTLTKKTSYYILSSETKGGDTWANQLTRVSTSTAASVTAPVYTPNSLTFVPNGGPSYSYGPLDFSYSATQPSTGLNAQWMLTQASISGTTAADASGNNNTATVANGPLTFGSMGANLNGQQYLDSPLTIGWAALTVSIWFNPASFSTGDSRLVANAHTDFGDRKGFQLIFRNGGGSGFFDVGSGTAEGRAEWSKQLTLNTWYHYVGVYDGATVRAYLNGTQVGSSSFSGGSIAPSAHINVGRNPVYAGDYFRGAVADVRLYDKALSEAEITALFQATTPPPPLPATPTAITLSPPSVSLQDNSPAGTRVCSVSVEMSDGSQFVGTLTTSDTNFFAISGSDVVTARALTPADDGSHSTTITATQGGQSASIRVKR